MILFNNLPDILTVSDVAKALRISEGSVYKLLHEKSLGYKHIGRKYIIPKSALQDFVNSAKYTVENL